MIEVKDDSLVERKKKKAKKSKEKKIEDNQENVEDVLVEPKKKAKKRKKSEITEESTQLEDNGEVKKEKKSKFKISLNADGCEPPVPVKAKKPFWANKPNKGPKILIATGENEETAAKRKKKEKDKKRKKKQGEEDRVHETQGHSKAVRYLTSWAEDRQNWKFEKCRQIWLLQHCYDPLKIPDAIFPTLVEYMNSIRGKMREVALERAKEKMEKGQKQLEVIAEEGDKSSEEVPKKKKKADSGKAEEEASEEAIDDAGKAVEEEGDKTSEEVPKKKKKKKAAEVVAKIEPISEAELKRATQIVEMLLE